VSTPTTRQMLVLGFPEYAVQAGRLAALLGVPCSEVGLHRFPDGETRVRLPPRLPEWVVVCRSLNDPNEKLLELGLVSATARELGATRLTLVAPYLCYMRQDTAFHPGEAVSQRVVGSMLARWFDDLVTVDPHLHRVASLGDAVPVRCPLALSAVGPLAAFIGGQVPGAVIVGPDAESAQWVVPIAEATGSGHLVASKRRTGDREVEVQLPAADLAGRDLVIVDDVASTGRTLEVLARELNRRRPASLSVAVTHALFFGDALDRLGRAGVSRVWSTDSVGHASNAVRLDRLLAAGVASLGEDAEAVPAEARIPLN
jgi:ribose-phosphate pyrophosphokinase